MHGARSRELRAAAAQGAAQQLLSRPYKREKDVKSEIRAVRSERVGYCGREFASLELRRHN